MGRTVLASWRAWLLSAGFALILVAVPLAAEAQVCRRGKPCGNTCIAQNRTCRVGPGTARSAGSPAPSTPAPARAAAAVPEGAAFVASSRGSVYYWTGCSAWRSLSQANLRFFASREEAVAAGYRPSASAGCAGPADLPPPLPPPTAPDAGAAAFTGPSAAPCTVANVVDGDTLDCADGRRIRLLLVDAPEMGQGSFGALARQALAGLAPAGSALTVEVDVDLADRYGRTLAHLYGAEGPSVNRQLLEMGVAVVAVYPPNVRHVEEYRAAVQEAQAARRGLWALDAFACEPSSYRAGRCGN